MALVVSVMFSRENTSPGLILTSFVNSSSGTSNWPASLTEDMVYFSPSLILMVV